MKFSEYVKRVERENVILLVNTRTRDWYKISNEIFGIINYGVEKQYNREKLLAAMYDEEDRDIILKVINNLSNKGIIIEDDKTEIPAELNFTVAITNRCNLTCKHCSYSAKLCQNTIEKVTYEQLKDRLMKIIALKPTTITFTGGEPMVRSDFLGLSEWVRTKFEGQMFLMTNGTLITEENVDQLIKIYSHIDISIDGVDEWTCSQIRGEGVFTKVLKSVDLLQKKGFSKISLSMVDTHITHRFINQFFDLNKKLKTHPVLRNFSEVGRGKQNKEKLQLRQEDYSEIELTDEFKKNYQKNFKASGCGAGKGVFFVDYDGAIYGCATLRELGYNLGNIEQVENVIDSSKNEKYKDMLGDIPEKCKLCDVNIFCIECLGDFLNTKQNNFESFCSERKRCLNDIVWEMR